MPNVPVTISTEFNVPTDGQITYTAKGSGVTVTLVLSLKEHMGVSEDKIRESLQFRANKLYYGS